MQKINSFNVGIFVTDYISTKRCII